MKGGMAYKGYTYSDADIALLEAAVTVFADSCVVSITTLLPLRDVGEAGEGGSCEGNMEERRTIPGRHHRIQCLRVSL